MENLRTQLEYIKTKCQSSEASSFILKEFQRLVKSKEIIVNDDNPSSPYFIFYIRDLALPENAKFKIDDWRHRKEYVLKTIQEGTKLEVIYSEEFDAIELFLPDNRGEEVKSCPCSSTGKHRYCCNTNDVMTSSNEERRIS